MPGQLLEGRQRLMGVYTEFYEPAYSGAIPTPDLTLTITPPGGSPTDYTEYLTYSGHQQQFTAVMYSSSSATASVQIFASPAATAAQGSFALPSTVTPPASIHAASLPTAITY